MKKGSPFIELISNQGRTKSFIKSKTNQIFRDGHVSLEFDENLKTVILLSKMVNKLAISYRDMMKKKSTD